MPNETNPNEAGKAAAGESPSKSSRKRLGSVGLYLLCFGIVGVFNFLVFMLGISIAFSEHGGPFWHVVGEICSYYLFTPVLLVRSVFPSGFDNLLAHFLQTAIEAAMLMGIVALWRNDWSREREQPDI